MQISEAIDQLQDWIRRSNGEIIEIRQGLECKFTSNAIFDETDFHAIEQALNCSLPSTYRILMKQAGQSQLFIDQYGLGIHLYSPSEVIDASQNIWDEEEEPGVDRFCLIGHYSGLGDYFGFVINHQGPTNFDIFCHEYPPSEYAETSDELNSWRTLDDWIIQVVSSYGKEIL